MDVERTFRYYLNCSEMPIWNFHQLSKTMDYRYLAKSQEIEDVDQIPIDSPKIWESIFNEYCDISDNTESQEHLRQVAELDELEKKYITTSMLFDGAIEIEDESIRQKYLDELSQWGFSFNNGNFEKEIKRVETWLKSVKTRMGMLSADIKEYKNRKSGPESLERQQVKLERASGRNEIDVKRCSVAKWLEIIKDTEKVAREREKQRKKAA